MFYLVIAYANAVVNPGTVVVHFDDAAAAYAAVVRPSWLEGLTPLAELTEFIAVDPKQNGSLSCLAYSEI